MALPRRHWACCSARMMWVAACGACLALAARSGLGLDEPRAALNLFVSQQCREAADPILSTDALEWAAELRRAHTDMQEELQAFLRRGHELPWFDALSNYENSRASYDTARRTNRSHVWGALWLKVWGRETELGNAFFPKSLRAVRQSALSSAMFSGLRPGQSVDWHVGHSTGFCDTTSACEFPWQTRRRSCL